MSSHRPKILQLLAILVVLTLVSIPSHARAETAPSKEKPDATITINVFGAVEKPGAYPLPKNSTLLDALGAAGGWKPQAQQKRISLIRGPAGEKPTVTTHNLEAILRGEEVSPPLQDRDALLVPERIF